MEVIRAVPGVRSRLPVTATVEEARASLNLGGPGIARATVGNRPPQEILVPFLESAKRRSGDGAGLPPRQSRRGRRRGSESASAFGLCAGSPAQPAAYISPLPEEEAAAGQALDAASQGARCEGVSAERLVTRARDAGEEDRRAGQPG